MTLLPRLALVATALLAGASSLRAQVLINPNGVPYAPLLTLPQGHSLGGLEATSTGDIYYLDVDTAPTDADGDRNTRLMRLRAGGGTTELFNFGTQGFSTGPFGSFVRLHGQELYFGENSTGTLWHGTLTAGGTVLSGATKFATVAGNYDLAFSNTGDAFLSANPGGFLPQNQVYLLTLDGSTSVRLDTSGDYSGPLAFDTQGRLLYGSAGFTSAGGLFRYSTTELAGPTAATLDAGHLLLGNGSNGYLAFNLDGTRLVQDAGNVLQEYLYTANLPGTVLAQSPDGFLGAVSIAGGSIYTVVTSGFGDSSRAAVYKLVPEPGSALLLLSGLAAVAGVRRREKVSR